MKRQILFSLGLLFAFTLVRAADAPVPRTGQTTSYRAEDDGDVKPGVAWPNPRFTDLGNGAFSDNLTGLSWPRNMKVGGEMAWDAAIDYCNTLTLGGHEDWRLSTVNELRSLLSYVGGTPMLPTGHLFTNVPTSHNYCWSSTTSPSSSSTNNAYRANLFNGPVQAIAKTNLYYVLPVRGAPEP